MAAPNNPYSAVPAGTDPALVRQIRQASQASSGDFGLLMAQAQQESGFHSDAKAATGSAEGLFQFIDSTWLDMVHRFGAKYGVGTLAQKISVDDAGKPAVANAATRRQILALRSDPTLSAALAGEYANLNRNEVEHALGHAVGRVDLYMAHFLGPGGAAHFLKALETRGSTPAAELLPEAAASNRGVFYDNATGRARSVAEIYRTLGGRIEQEARDLGGEAPDAQDATDAAAAGANAASTAAATSGGARRLDFGGLTLSQPIAAMLDTLTLAALKLVGPAPQPPRKPDAPT